MTSQPITSIYGQLIEQAHRVMRGASFMPRCDELKELYELVLDEVSKPVDGPRLIFDVEVWLAQAILHVEQSREQKDPRHERLWLQIAGVLLPDVKDHAYEALRAQQRGPSTTDQDYSRR